MNIQCVWEHNGNDSLLYATSLPGAYSRGASLDACIRKMESECRSFLQWKGAAVPEKIQIEIVQDASCQLEIRDADSDVLFEAEKTALTVEEYLVLKKLALKSAEDFLDLYASVPDPDKNLSMPRRTFYGMIPSTAREMYLHTKNVNDYYFAEIDVDADHEGSILDCRARGFESLEKKADFLSNAVMEGSYGELWNLRKVIRRFIWHDRIHAKAMYRKAIQLFGTDRIANPFYFET